MSHAALEAEVSPDEATEFVPLVPPWGERDRVRPGPPGRVRGAARRHRGRVHRGRARRAGVGRGSRRAAASGGVSVRGVSVHGVSVGGGSRRRSSSPWKRRRCRRPLRWSSTVFDAPRREPPRVVPNPVAAPRVPLPAPAPVEAPRPFVPLIEDRLRHSRNLAAVLTPFGALEVGSTQHRGRDALHLQLFGPARRLRDADGGLHAAVPHERAGLVGDRPGHGPSRARAIILTPLGPVDSGGPSWWHRWAAWARWPCWSWYASRPPASTGSRIPPRHHAVGHPTGRGATCSTRRGTRAPCPSASWPGTSTPSGGCLPPCSVIPPGAPRCACSSRPGRTAGRWPASRWTSAAR